MQWDAVSSIRVNNEARERAVFVAVAAMRFASVELDEDLVARVQVQDHAVACVVVILVRVLGNGAGPDLSRENTTTALWPVRSWGDERLSRCS